MWLGQLFGISKEKMRAGGQKSKHLQKMIDFSFFPLLNGGMWGGASTWGNVQSRAATGLGII